MSKSNNWSEAKVFVLLEQVFRPGPWVLLPQVRNGVGFSRETVCTADAIAVSVWPSRGLGLTGIEIKVSRADWKKELATPEKSAGIQQFCECWCIATPKGIVEPGELPKTWGLIECTEKRARQVVGATVIEVSSPDLSFTCAILRAASQAMVPKAIAVELKEKERTAWKRGLKEGREKEQEENRYAIDILEKTVADFEKASGVTISDTWNTEQIGDAVRAVREGGPSMLDNVLARAEPPLRTALEKLQEARSSLKETS